MGLDVLFPKEFIERALASPDFKKTLAESHSHENNHRSLNNSLMIDIQQARKSLTSMQKLKLETAAQILKETAHIYNGLAVDRESMLPLWAAGVVTHGQPNTKLFEIGITEAAKKAKRQDTTKDHLFRVTETAKLILTKAPALTVEEIQNLLIERSIKMKTTRTENHTTLKRALNGCKDRDNWKHLYKHAGVDYELYTKASQPGLEDAESP